LAGYQVPAIKEDFDLSVFQLRRQRGDKSVIT
jgi:hypothetical protein